MSRIPKLPTSQPEKPQPYDDGESFLSKWAWLIFVILFMLIFWGTFLHDAFQLSTTK